MLKCSEVFNLLPQAQELPTRLQVACLPGLHIKTITAGTPVVDSGGDLEVFIETLFGWNKQIYPLKSAGSLKINYPWDGTGSLHTCVVL